MICVAAGIGRIRGGADRVAGEADQTGDEAARAKLDGGAPRID